MARVIVVTSGKGGVGKTTVTAGLGRALATKGKRVVLMDADLGLNNLDVVMDAESRVVYDILDVVENRCRPRQALVEDLVAPGLFIMPGASYDDGDKISGQNLRAIVNSLSQSFDYIFIDCPAGIEVGFHRAVSAADEALVVTTPHVSALRDADKVVAIIKSYKIKASLVVNRARGDMILGQEQLSYIRVVANSSDRSFTRRRRDKHIQLLSYRREGKNGRRQSDRHACRKYFARHRQAFRRYQKVSRIFRRAQAFA